MNHRLTIVTICVVVAIVAVVITGSAFAIVRSMHEGSEVRAQPPPDPKAGLDTTPVPGITPDKSQPGWYVPYLNADRGKPQFVGKLAGIDIRPFDASVPVEDAGGCPPGTAQLRERVGDELNNDPLGIRLGALVKATAPTEHPKALECDGRLVTVDQHFNVLSADGSGTVTGSLKVFRSSVGHRFWLPAPEDRWATAVVAGRQAATLKPVIGTVGTSAVILNDGRGYTAVLGEGVTLQFLQRAAEEIER